jgi:hypothetical protein
MSKQEKFWLFMCAFSLLAIQGVEIPLFKLFFVLVAVGSAVGFIVEEGKR